MVHIDFENSSGLRPTFLGRRFRLDGVPEIYIALGLKGRNANVVVLQNESTEEIRNMTIVEFQKLATRADE
jgi:hypothetical protein